jgi:chromosome partitioning protein
MPVIAVVNPKGGSGKSTLATHLAGHGARRGLSVMLGDVDRQKSTLVWLRRRAMEPVARHAPITSWVVDPNRVLRPPPGVTHVVLDTPGGLHGHELARTVMCADAIVMPVCDSAFDRDAAAQCWAELQSHPRVASGRCRVAAVGMRIDARTRAHETLLAWARNIGLPFLGVLRDTQIYVRCVERGLTIFDLPADRTRADRDQWAVILDWLDELWAIKELGTASQAGALAAPAEPEVAATPPRDAADMWVDGPPPVRVTPARRPPAPQLHELAAALAPRQAPARASGGARHWLAQAIGWLPARLAR